MTKSKSPKRDPKLDLVLERIVDVPKELVWAAWTTPKHILEWFTPKPWKTVECEIDLRPGGRFWTVMQSPEGEKFPNTGCYLEVVENTRLVWTDALEPGFRPCRKAFEVKETCGISCFTGIIELADHPKGTRYTATALHKSEEEAKSHLAMGFHDGWGKALDQLVELAKGMKKAKAGKKK